MRSFRRQPSSGYEVSASAVAVAIGLILVSDALLPEAGEPVWLAGSLDEIAHLANGVVALGVLGPDVDRRLARGLIAASVLIDADHVPHHAGARWLTEGTARPYPHSLLTMMGSAAVFWAVSRRAPRSDASRTALGILIGLGAHFFRDLAVPGTGLPLLWPIKNRAFSIPRRFYVASLAGALGRSLADRHGKGRRFA